MSGKSKNQEKRLDSVYVSQIDVETVVHFATGWGFEGAIERREGFTQGRKERAANDRSSPPPMADSARGNGTQRDPGITRRGQLVTTIIQSGS